MSLLETYEGNNGEIWYCEKCKKFEIKIKECDHKFKMYKIDYGNENFHIVTKCENCGEHKKTHKKKGKNIDKLPTFDLSESKKWSQDLIKIKYNLELKIKDYRIKFKKKSNAWNIEKWYYGYLESNIWKRKRDWILNKNDFKCERCGDKAKFVHHKTYDRVGYEKPEDLMTVCLSCHGKEHSEHPNLNIVNQFKLHDL